MGLQTDEALAILQGGLRSYLDYGASAAATAQGDSRSEQTPPVGRATDRDTASGAAKTASIFDRLTAKDYAIGVGGLLVVGVFMAFVFRGVAKI